MPLQWIYPYNNQPVGIAQYAQGQGDITGVCMGATLLWARDILRGRAPQDTWPNFTAAFNASVAYGAGVVSAAHNHAPNPAWDITTGLTFLNLRSHGQAISGSGTMVLNTLLTTAESRAVYVLNLADHTLGIYKVSANVFYLFDANNGLGFGSRLDVHGQFYTDNITGPLMPQQAEAQRILLP